MANLQYVHAGFGDDAVPYGQAWEEQRRLHAARVADESPDTCLLLEHAPVYTAGKRTRQFERPDEGVPVIDADRGGKITWHGPGQLTGYPLVKLPDPVDVLAYVQRLEHALMDVCRDLGLDTIRVEGRNGVWVPGSGSDRNGAGDVGPEDRKVAAIGVRVARGVTMHGFALNCDCDMGWFDRIVPCGITDAGVTSLSRELGYTVTVQDVLPLVEKRLSAALDFSQA